MAEVPGIKVSFLKNVLLTINWTLHLLAVFKKQKSHLLVTNAWGASWSDCLQETKWKQNCRVTPGCERNELSIMVMRSTRPALRSQSVHFPTSSTSLVAKKKSSFLKSYRLVRNLLTLASDFAQWATEITLNTVRTMLCVHTVFVRSCWITSCLFPINGVWRDYADSVYNQDAGTVVAQVTVSVCVRSVAGCVSMANCQRTSKARWSRDRRSGEWKHSEALFVLCAKGKRGREPHTNPLLQSLI